MPLSQGISGALGGLAAGGPIGGLIGGISGLFGLGGRHTDPNMEAMRRQQQGIANQMLGYANSVPGSSPDELANLSQSRGLLGQQQRANQQRAFAAYNPSQGLPAAQMLQNMGNANIAQQMGLQSSFLQDAAANRRQALMQAANLGQGAASLYKPEQSQFGQVAGQLAQMLAYQKARGQSAGGAAGGGSNADVNLLNQQAGGMGNWYNPTSGDAGPQAPAGFANQAPAMNPALMSMLQQSGWSGPGVPMVGAPAFNASTGPEATIQGMQGAQAPGNESPGGLNGLQNQLRQSSGASTPMTGATGSINAMLRKILLPGGVSLHF